MKRRLSRDEQRAARRAQGRWAYIFEEAKINLTPAIRGLGVFRFQRGPGAGKREVWGLDGLLTLTIEGTTPETLAGALVTFHIRPGQVAANWFTDQGNLALGLPQGEIEGNDKARFDKFIPLALLGDDTSTRGSIAIPWHNFVPKELTLKPGEVYQCVVSMGGTTSVNLLVRAVGRYRYMDSTV